MAQRRCLRAIAASACAVAPILCAVQTRAMADTAPIVTVRLDSKQPAQWSIVNRSPVQLTMLATLLSPTGSAYPLTLSDPPEKSGAGGKEAVPLAPVEGVMINMPPGGLAKLTTTASSDDLKTSTLRVIAADDTGRSVIDISTAVTAAVAFKPGATKLSFDNGSSKTIGTIPLTESSPPCDAQALKAFTPATVVRSNEARAVDLTCQGERAVQLKWAKKGAQDGETYEGTILLSGAKEEAVAVTIRRSVAWLVFVAVAVGGAFLGILSAMWGGSIRRRRLVNLELDVLSKDTIPKSTAQFATEAGDKLDHYDPSVAWQAELERVGGAYRDVKSMFGLSDKDNAVLKDALALETAVVNWSAAAPPLIELRTVITLWDALTTEQSPMDQFAGWLDQKLRPTLTSSSNAISYSYSQSMATECAAAAVVVRRMVTEKPIETLKALEHDVNTAASRSANPISTDTKEALLEQIATARQAVVGAAAPAALATALNLVQVAKSTFASLGTQPQSGSGPGTLPIPAQAIAAPRIRRSHMGFVYLADALSVFVVAGAAVGTEYATLYNGKAFGKTSDYLATIAWGFGGGLAGTAMQSVIGVIRERRIADLVSVETKKA